MDDPVREGIALVRKKPGAGKPRSTRAGLPQTAQTAQGRFPPARPHGRTKGDVYALRATEMGGHEQRGPRFAVVVQSSRLEHLSTGLVVPTSTRAQRYIFRPIVEIPDQGETAAVCDAMTAVDPQARLGEHLGYLPLAQMQRIDQAVLALLDLD